MVTCRSLRPLQRWALKPLIHSISWNQCVERHCMIIYGQKGLEYCETDLIKLSNYNSKCSIENYMQIAWLTMKTNQNMSKIWPIWIESIHIETWWNLSERSLWHLWGCYQVMSTWQGLGIWQVQSRRLSQLILNFVMWQLRAGLSLWSSVVYSCLKL